MPVGEKGRRIPEKVEKPEEKQRWERESSVREIPGARLGSCAECLIKC